MHDGQKFLIDTELDDDIDDALALFAAMQSRFNLLGVTIVGFFLLLIENPLVCPLQ